LLRKHDSDVSIAGEFRERRQETPTPGTEFSV
jgi:hypothetical protein